MREKPEGHIRVEFNIAPINGLNMHYRSVGQGPALMFLHAGICDGGMWTEQIETFQKTHRVIAPDLRGYGRTRMIAGQYAHRFDILALMDYLEIERARVVGASMAGRAAIELAIERPERIEALVAVGAALSGYVFKDRDLLAMDDAIDKALADNRWQEAADLDLKLWLIGLRRTPEAIDKALHARVRKMILSSYETPADMRGEIPLRPPAILRLSEIRAPTLVMWGDEDAADIAAIGEILARDIAGARKAVMANAAHLPNMERPKEFNRILRDFLTNLR